MEERRGREGMEMEPLREIGILLKEKQIDEGNTKTTNGHFRRCSDVKCFDSRFTFSFFYLPVLIYYFISIPIPLCFLLRSKQVRAPLEERSPSAIFFWHLTIAFENSHVPSLCPRTSSLAVSPKKK